jgi:hypothetical protein
MSEKIGEGANYEKLRQTGMYAIDDYSPEEVDVWMVMAKLPPRIGSDELWHQWAQRTGERPVDQTQVTTEPPIEQES